MGLTDHNRKIGALGKHGGASGKDKGIEGKEYGINGGRPKKLKVSGSNLEGFPKADYSEILKFLSKSELPTKLTIEYQLQNTEN